MGYRSIDNLYRYQDILQTGPEVFCLEKVNGTSSHVAYDGDSEIRLFHGGSKKEQFEALFDISSLLTRFQDIFGNQKVIVYGEAYGGKVQGMSATYGKNLKFIAFEVKIEDDWQDVPVANNYCNMLGLEFVHYERGPNTVEWINSQRDKPSTQAKRNGIEGDKIAEGVVIRCIHEQRDHRGNRIMAKHKRSEFSETKTYKEVSPEKLVILIEANEIANEWVTEQRMAHVLDKYPISDISQISKLIGCMQEDVKKESIGEVVWSKDVERAIGRKTVQVYKTKYCQLTG